MEFLGLALCSQWAGEMFNVTHDNVTPESIGEVDLLFPEYWFNELIWSFRHIFVIRLELLTSQK